MSIIMRATLHDPAPNTYYGQWPGRKSRCLRASNRRPLPMMSALRAPDSWPLTFRSEISQRIARRCSWKFVCRPKRKVCAQGGVAEQQRSSPPSSCLPRLRGRLSHMFSPSSRVARGNPCALAKRSRGTSFRGAECESPSSTLWRAIQAGLPIEPHETAPDAIARRETAEELESRQEDRAHKSRQSRLARPERRNSRLWLGRRKEVPRLRSGRRKWLNAIDLSLRGRHALS